MGDDAQVLRAARTIRFEARLQAVADEVIVRLPADASARLPSRGQVAVTGVIDGHPFQTVVEPDGRRGHWLKLSQELRRTLAPQLGENATLEVAAAEQWPEPDVPEDFQAALTEAPDVSEVWPSITPMARWEWVRWINATRNPLTRQRRVAVGIDKLRSGKRRPCCFDLAACTDPELSKNGKLIDAG